ncbi:MAG: heavy metal translocating P-type ATPase [Nesterenkonia sp.]
MSAACCAPDTNPAAGQQADETRAPWWLDRALLIPILSGAAFLTALILGWSAAETMALIMFWIGLALGASTFMPGALVSLFTQGRAGIGLLMSISAVGAVLLGHVQEAAALAFLYSIAEALEDKAMERARGGLRALLELVPQTAVVMRGRTPVEIAAAELTAGEVLLVRAGERIATDGVVHSGRSSLDTSAITGESIPAEVEPGDAVSAGAINSSGALEITTTADGRDNSLTTIVELVEQAQAKKGHRARLADKIARPLVPGVMILALLVGVVGSLVGDPETWITRALVVLVAASPCALAIAVPVTVTSAIGAASRFGVIIKSGAAFERAGDIRHLAMDKTGTLTRHEPTVTAVVAAADFSEDQVLAYAAAVEQRSTHPLAAAITAAASHVPAAEATSEQAGHGISGTVQGRSVSVGSPRWVDAGALTAEVEALEETGQTCVITTVDDRVIGIIGVRDELRPEVPELVRTLTRDGIAVTMLTGDNPRTAHALGQAAGITDVRAELRPEEKADAVVELDRRRPTAMIGDGVNDSPALAAASVGIAMGARGTDAAIESADVAFTGHDLRLIPAALQHTRRGRRLIKQNIVLSLLIIIVLLPLAVTGTLGLAAVVLVHEVAEIVVIGNGLRAVRTPHLPSDRHSRQPERSWSQLPHTP